jgi:hypothetical protein
VRVNRGSRYRHCESAACRCSFLDCSLDGSTGSQVLIVGTFGRAKV